MYEVVKDSMGVRRSFVITCGLKAGYGKTATTFVFEEAVNFILRWMKMKAANKKPFLTGSVTIGEVVYAWPSGEGTADGGSEPVFKFEGEASPLYSDSMTDEQVSEILNDLAIRLGTAFHQTRVYVAYRDVVWILQDEKEKTPTGD